MNNAAKKTYPIDLVGNETFYFKMGDDKYCQKRFGAFTKMGINGEHPIDIKTSNTLMDALLGGEVITKEEYDSLG